MKPRSSSLVDLIEQSSYFFCEPAEYSERDLSKVWKVAAPEIMKELQTILESISDWIPNEIESKFKEFMDSNGLGFGKVMRPLRFALCGNVNGLTKTCNRVVIICLILRFFNGRLILYDPLSVSKCHWCLNCRTTNLS
mgnify:CR=1 FL=1